MYINLVVDWAYVIKLFLQLLILGAMSQLQTYFEKYLQPFIFFITYELALVYSLECYITLGWKNTLGYWAHL